MTKHSDTWFSHVTECAAGRKPCRKETPDLVRDGRSPSFYREPGQPRKMPQHSNLQVQVTHARSPEGNVEMVSRSVKLATPDSKVNLDL